MNNQTIDRNNIMSMIIIQQFVQFFKAAQIIEVIGNSASFFQMHYHILVE
jgi:hypothetical protein